MISLFKKETYTHNSHSINQKPKKMVKNLKLTLQKDQDKIHAEWNNGMLYLSDGINLISISMPEYNYELLKTKLQKQVERWKNNPSLKELASSLNG